MIGILFCGGKGERLEEITKYTSKAFIPVYNKPSYLYPLKQLENSEYINRIVILTNSDNWRELHKFNYFTNKIYKIITQNNEKVYDMFSGLNYIKQHIDIDETCILMPCDNISNIKIDNVINTFLSKENIDFTFCIKNIKNIKKLKEMGTYNIYEDKFMYRSNSPYSNFGVITPYILKNTFNPTTEEEAFSTKNKLVYHYTGEWFDVGDVDSLLDASIYIRSKEVNI